MQISDLNRLEKYLAKFKYYVSAGYEPSPEEINAIQTIEAQVEQIEETLFNLRAVKGSVAGVLIRSFKAACPQEMKEISVTATEKGFSLIVPFFSYNYYRDQNRNVYERVSQWAHNLNSSYMRHNQGQEVPESEIDIFVKLNQISPKLKMYNFRYTGNLEFHFDISKKLAQSETDRDLIAHEVMGIIQRFVNQKKNELGIPEQPQEETID